MRRDVDLGDRKVTVVGTKHVSSHSVKEVEKVIEDVKPDLVGVELDEDRLNSLRGGSKWKELDLVEAIRNGQGYLLAANVFLMIYQKQLGLAEGVKPGAELLNAVEVAEKRDIPVELVDRNINDTFRRAYDNLSFWEKLKLLAGLIPTGKEDDLEIELEEDILDTLVKELEDEFPTLGKVFLEERNQYMAEKLLEKEFDHAVLVVGAAHVQGIIEDLEQENSYEEKPIKKTNILKYLHYGFPPLVIGLMAYGFMSGGMEQLIELGIIWFGLNSLLAGIGAILARSHKKTWAAATVASPFTSLTPVIGAGIVAAYVEARYHPPTVEELEKVSEITSFKDLRNNQVGIILATLVLVSILGAAATFIAAGLMSLTFL